MGRLLPKTSSLSATSLKGVQHFVFEGVNWGFYERLLREVGERPIRITYDQGRLEIMSPLAEHEGAKKIFGLLIEMLTFELDMPVKSLGSTTFRNKSKAKGLDPDECYYFREERKMRARKRIHIEKDPPPELVLEIDISSRSVATEPIYAALGVAELWRWDGFGLECLHLVGGAYRVRKYSLAFPFLEPGRLAQFIKVLPEKDETRIIREFVTWVRGNGWSRQM